MWPIWRNCTRLLVVRKLLAGEEEEEDDLPSGEEGIYFSANGHHTWLELASGLADAMFTLGVCETEEVQSISLEEAAEKWAGRDTLLAELGYCFEVSERAVLFEDVSVEIAESRRAVHGRSRSLVGVWVGGRISRIGTFKNHFQTEVEKIMEEKKKNG